MRRTAAICAIALTGILGLASCTSTPTSPPPAAEEAAEPVSSTETEDGADAEAEAAAAADVDGAAPGGETTIPNGAVAASPEFPFPVPEGWEELYPFTQEKIGKDVAMSAIYGHPGDAESAAALYHQLLQDAGFTVADNPVGSLTNAASLSVEGDVAGTYYAGSLDFDTDAEGTARVVINLTED